MIINNNDTPDIARLSQTALGKAQESSRASSTAASAATGPDASPGDDSISLSSSPNLVQQALNSPSPARAARTQELKALVATGQYNPDAQQVASALVDAHLAGA